MGTSEATWTEADIGDQSGRVALITGANSGIGFEAARALAQHGAHVVLACRNAEKAAEAEVQINALDPSGTVEVLVMDLGDLESVAAAAQEFTDAHRRLDLLVNNAGLMGTPRGTTAQGFETQFGVNHLGHVALTAHLLPRLLSTEESRVVTVSSTAHRFGRIDVDDLQSESRYRPWRAYGQSKLANLLFTLELQRRLEAAGSSTIAVAAHPGGSNTNLGHENPGGILNTVFFAVKPIADRIMQSAAMGALPTLRAAVDPHVVGGEYLGPGGFLEQAGHPVTVGMTDRAEDADAARRLWDVSVELTGADFGPLA